MRSLRVLLLLFLTQPSLAVEPGLQARCDNLLAKWKDRLDADHFASLVSPPFVLAGDGGNEKLRIYRDRTVMAAARALHATYFDAEPDKPILIFLFESEEPYKQLAKKWFDDDDVPHFGFCRSDGIMLMNISTGGGTLVHELVHALIKPDFPSVPTWLNEGLASLYEQCDLDGDHIVGLKNWRLPALKKAIREDRLRPLDEMIADPKFYDSQQVGLNYAQARYLLMYLQEKGLLKQFYKDFRSRQKDDPTGVATLHALAPENWAGFEKQWRQWVSGL